jgi:hypothetical protein
MPGSGRKHSSAPRRESAMGQLTTGSASAIPHQPKRRFLRHVILAVVGPLLLWRSVPLLSGGDPRPNSRPADGWSAQAASAQTRHQGPTRFSLLPRQNQPDTQESRTLLGASGLLSSPRPSAASSGGHQPRELGAKASMEGACSAEQPTQPLGRQTNIWPSVPSNAARPRWAADSAVDPAFGPPDQA